MLDVLFTEHKHVSPAFGTNKHEHNKQNTPIICNEHK